MFKDILLPVDLEDLATSTKAVSTAITMSKNQGAKLHVLAVLPGYGMSIISQYFPEDFEEKSLVAAREGLNGFIGEKIPSDIKTQAIVANGTVYKEILRVAEETKCDLIVMASHRHELRDYLLGPNASRVVRHANCSVLVVRD